jgi:hypothetical protein
MAKFVELLQENASSVSWRLPGTLLFLAKRKGGDLPQLVSLGSFHEFMCGLEDSAVTAFVVDDYLVYA